MSATAQAGEEIKHWLEQGVKQKGNTDLGVRLVGAEEEADGTLYWLELLRESSLVGAERLSGLMQEARETVAILTASRNMAKGPGRK